MTRNQIRHTNEGQSYIHKFIIAQNNYRKLVEEERLHRKLKRTADGGISKTR